MFFVNGGEGACFESPVGLMLKNNYTLINGQWQLMNYTNCIVTLQKTKKYSDKLNRFLCGFTTVE